MPAPRRDLCLDALGEGVSDVSGLLGYVRCLPDKRQSACATCPHCESLLLTPILACSPVHLIPPASVSPAAAGAGLG